MAAGVKTAGALASFWTQLQETGTVTGAKADVKKSDPKKSDAGKSTKSSRREARDRDARRGDHDDEDEEAKPLLPRSEDRRLARKHEKARQRREQQGLKDKRGGRHRDRHGDSTRSGTGKPSPSDKSSQHRRKSRASILNVNRKVGPGVGAGRDEEFTGFPPEFCRNFTRILQEFYWTFEGVRMRISKRRRSWR